MNGEIAPKSIVVEVADLIPLGGRQNFRARYGERPEMLPGFVPPACNPKDSMGTREIRRVQAKACRARQADKGENGPMTWRKSDWLIVLRGRESRLHGEAASGS